MTVRISVATRLAVVAAIALLAAWVTAAALYYLLHERDHNSDRLAPAQAAAIADLLEREPELQRPLALAAVNSWFLTARMEAGLSLEPPAGSQPAAPVLRAGYRAALGDRPFSLYASPLALSAPFGARFRGLVDPLALRIGLRDGDTLVLESHNAILMTRLGLPAGFGAGLVGTLIALAATVLMFRATLPLVRIASALDAMDLAGEQVPLPQSRAQAPEIQAVVNAFNRLQARLAQLLRARLALLGGISHDVRTFATRLRLRLDDMVEGAQRDRAIDDIAAMIRLLDDSLLASRAGAHELAEEMVEFGEVVQIEVDDRRALGGGVDLTVSDRAKEVTVIGDPLALRRVVGNLIDNARSYGEAAHLRLDADEETVVLTVDDDGPGVPESLREILFEPFVRADASRSRKTGGAGLGLAVARALVEGQGGSIAAGDAPRGGARFTISLPQFKP